MSTPTLSATAKESARRDRVAAIRDGAITREHLGQGATHRRLPDGRHQVSYYDHHAGVLRTFSGDTLEEALGRANRREESP